MLRAVATDGHRLARVETPAPEGSVGMPGIIAPRKAVNEVQKLLEDLTQDVAIEISTAKARFQFGDVVLTTKLIDGTFPDYARVIPTGNDKRLVVDKEPFQKAVDRVVDPLVRARPGDQARDRRGQDDAIGQQSGFRARPARRSRPIMIPRRSISASTPAICSTSSASCRPTPP